MDVWLIANCCSDVVINDIYPISLYCRGEIQAERAATYALYNQMHSYGLEFQRAAPTGFLGMYMLYRNHKKIMVIDDTTAFVSGICVSDDNFFWHDLHVFIRAHRCLLDVSVLHKGV